MEKIIIVAASENNVIGLEGKIPWEIPEDMERFKKLTSNHPVIMGSKTFFSIPKKYRPLPDRKNIVLSRSMEDSEGIYVARTVDEALELAEDEDTYVIGGGDVYEQFFFLANKIELTRVHREYKGDTFFPEIDSDVWKEVEKQSKIHEDLLYSFITYEKRN
ncbi:MAG: dihydrofolate reductase [Candidatus Nanoarchaeia archaeon]|jgi:dihydrofolate reductase|nr:dihydrofolate reductase [Candidatus Nanoarchaeia archaeon]|tara:strand:+ start:4564 stop:5046 length:483 start_codon:yes stop_codon:yes gene_type:complete